MVANAILGGVQCVLGLPPPLHNIILGPNTRRNNYVEPSGSNGGFRITANRDNMPVSDIGALANAQQNELVEFNCNICDRRFTTKTGLGVHRKKAHPEVANEEVVVERKKKRWNSEEMSVVAREEARASQEGVRLLNLHLHSKFPDRTVESIKGMRRRPDYKQMVEEYINELRQQQQANSSEENQNNTSQNNTVQPLVGPPDIDIINAIQNNINELNNSSSRLQGNLKLIAQKALNGENVIDDLNIWIGSIGDEHSATDESQPQQRARVRSYRNRNRRYRNRNNPSNRRDRTQRSEQAVSRRRQRRREFAALQSMYRNNMSRAVEFVLDGPNSANTPSLDSMVEYWRPLLTKPSAAVAQNGGQGTKESLGWIAGPVTLDEVKNIKIKLTSAPGLDGITSRRWNSIAPKLKVLFYNIILRIGGFPQQLLRSRTIFVPKKDGSSSPGDFRPISVASVVVRQLHKILADRLQKANLINNNQRCMEDGCAENITVLASVLSDARERVKELHLASLDVAKAFDSVSHNSIEKVLKGLGLPERFVSYITTSYRNSTTVLQVGRQRSDPIRVTCGVRQGDPLSTILFCMVIDRLMDSLPSSVGYTIMGRKVNVLAYADDLILLASSDKGMQESLLAVEEEAKTHGLTFNSNKCLALSIVPDGKNKKYKVLSNSRFRLSDGSPLKQLGPCNQWKYLGVNFSSVGVQKPGGTLESDLGKISRAPLKPQQRLKILRSFLIARYKYRFILSKSSLKILKAMDKQIRIAVRKWLRLPKDTPLGYFHASCKDGGLGIPSFATTVPGELHATLIKMGQSSLSSLHDIIEHPYVLRKLRWAEKVLTLENQTLLTSQDRRTYWAARLHNSVDGKELVECPATTISNTWVDGGSMGIPGRDYVQYHHVRINALPSRVRASRGNREGRSTVCRAGCGVEETTAHIIQSCCRTHGGRILRHDSICHTVANSLRNSGWEVRENPHYITSNGLMKPDIIAKKDDAVKIIDTQVVSGASSLNAAHRRKVAKYNIPQLKEKVARENGTTVQRVDVMSCTLSWRGVWASQSAEALLQLGISKQNLAGITTRTLQGSHMNWTRFNQMTTNISSHLYTRVPEGIG